MPHKALRNILVVYTCTFIRAKDLAYVLFLGLWMSVQASLFLLPFINIQYDNPLADSIHHSEHKVCINQCESYFIIVY